MLEFKVRGENIEVTDAMTDYIEAFVTLGALLER